jgi:hypothetical protein
MRDTPLTSDERARLPEFITHWVQIGLSAQPIEHSAAERAIVRRGKQGERRASIRMRKCRRVRDGRRRSPPDGANPANGMPPEGAR